MLGAAAAAAALFMIARAGIAEPVDVGALAAVHRNVYGVPPTGDQAVKREGDAVAFQETLETLEESSATIRFIDDSKLTLGAKSKVLIDEFVFDPKTVKGNALINISVGTLRFVTGEMPKGGVVIKTPTATLTLRGTDVVVHVHPDGTTDTTVYDGKVEAHNNVTNQVTNMVPGEAATLGHEGTSSFNHDDESDQAFDTGNSEIGDTPEHRRNDAPKVAEKPAPEPDHDEGNNDDSGDDDGGCNCI